MKIIVNGQEMALDQSLDITGLLEKRGQSAQMVAVARNGCFVPRAAYAQTFLVEGDQIEIVAPMQGG